MFPANYFKEDLNIPNQVYYFFLKKDFFWIVYFLFLGD